MGRGHGWRQQIPQGQEPHPCPPVPHVPSSPSTVLLTARSFQPSIIIPNLQINPAICAHSQNDSQSVCVCSSVWEGPRLQQKELGVPSEGTGGCPSILFPKGWARPRLLQELHPKFTAGSSAAATLPTRPPLRHAGDRRDQPALTPPRASSNPQTTPSPTKPPPTAFPNGADSAENLWVQG